MLNTSVQAYQQQQSAGNQWSEQYRTTTHSINQTRLNTTQSENDDR